MIFILTFCFVIEVCQDLNANVHEYNSDQATHALIESIFENGGRYITTEEWKTSGRPYLSISSEVLEQVVFSALKNQAELGAKKIADRAWSRAIDPKRWTGGVNLARVITEVLVDTDVRVGAVPS